MGRRMRRRSSPSSRGTRQIVTQSQRHVVALAPADGRLLWEIPFATDYEQNSVTPVVAAICDLRRTQQADDRRAADTGGREVGPDAGLAER